MSDCGKQLWRTMLLWAGLLACAAWICFFLFLSVAMFMMRGLADEPSGYRATIGFGLVMAAIPLAVSTPGVLGAIFLLRWQNRQACEGAEKKS